MMKALFHNYRFWLTLAATLSVFLVLSDRERRYQDHERNVNTMPQPVESYHPPQVPPEDNGVIFAGNSADSTSIDPRIKKPAALSTGSRLKGKPGTSRDEIIILSKSDQKSRLQSLPQLSDREEQLLNIN